MFSLTKMYTNYKQHTPEYLENLIRSEIQENFGASSIEKIAIINKCFKITKEYTNNHPKPTKKVKRNEKGEVVRISGEPYVNHTYRVALILFHEKFLDFELILAAIMHDLFEDTTYTYEDAKRDFGTDVAEYIRCVSNYSDVATDEYDPDETEEEKDYQTMLELCKERKLAFFIKFADRLDNLYTIDCMLAYKQNQKIKDTKKYLLPLIQQIGAHRFEALINDVAFKIDECITSGCDNNSYRYLEHALQQNRALKSTKSTLKQLETFCKRQSKLNRIELVSPTIYEIYQELNGAPLTSFSQENIIHKVYFIYNNLAVTPSLKDIVVDFIRAPEFQSYAISKINPDGFYFFDKIGNTYKAIIISSPDYQSYRFGNIDVEDLYFPDSNETITVFTPKGDPIKLPVGATVIDFAFAIHKEVGRYMIGATIENKKMERPEIEAKDIRMELNDGDIVRIIPSGYKEPEVTLSWVRHCQTHEAKKKICRIIQSNMNQLIEKVNRYEKLLDEHGIEYKKEK